MHNREAKDAEMRRLLSWKTLVLVFFLAGISSVLAEDIIVVSDLIFEEFAGGVKVTLTTDRAAKVLCYDISEPPQIIIDLMGDAFCCLPGLIEVNKGMATHIRAIKAVGKTPEGLDESYYAVDFLVVDLKEPIPYELSKEDSLAILKIGCKEERFVEEELEPPRRLAEIEPTEEYKLEIIEIEEEEEKPDIWTRMWRGLDEAFAKVTSVFKREPWEKKTSEEVRLRARDIRNEGYRYQMEGGIEKAIKSYQMAIRIDPDYACAHNDLGILYEQKGWVNEAEGEYKRTLEIDPKYIQAHSNLALLYEGTGQIKEAIYHWDRRARMGDPGDPWTQMSKEKLREYR